MERVLGDLRQRFRNPSVPFIVLVILIVLAIPAGILGPFVAREAIEGWEEYQNLQRPDFRGPPETWIRPWLVGRARSMQNASQPHEWRPADFEHGPCGTTNLRQLPTVDLRSVVESACDDLGTIQGDYAEDCVETGNCRVPEEAKRRISAVVDDLDEAFSGLNLSGGPVTEEQSAQ